jgi:NADPH-dependent ferric siderophore reductase
MVAEPRSLQLRVRGVVERTPRMREISLTSPELAEFSWLPGQDVSLGFTTAAGTVRRRYSIRRLDSHRRTLDIDVVMHGDGPGMRWAQQAQPEMAIDAIAPRGKITLVPGADRHLFAGDATAVAAALAMIEALPNPAHALGFFLVDDRAEQQEVPPGSRVEWRYREDDLRDALRQADLQNHAAHAYLAGEVGLVTALKADLLARGWTTERISAKAYWNRGRANAGHGEPEQKAS